MFIAGLVILLKAGDWLVDGAVSVAHRFKLSDVFIGVAIIGFGTSLPELLASLSAVRVGSPALAVGNAIGSNIANVGLILGLTLAVAGIFHKAKGQEKEYLSMLIVTVLFLVGIYTLGDIHTLFAGFMVLGLVIYLTLAMLAGRKNFDAALEAESEAHNNTAFKKALLLVGAGLVGLFIGAELLVRGALDIATFFEVPERIIGLTLMAIGTSLPELAAAISAAKRGRTALIFGNIMGSNVFNLFGVLGISGLFATLPVTAGTMLDSLVMLSFALFIVLLFFKPMARFARPIGIIMLIMYSLYMLKLSGLLPWSISA